MSDPKLPDDAWAQFAGPQPPGAVLAPPPAFTKPPPKAKRSAQVPGGGKKAADAPVARNATSVADETLRALIAVDEEAKAADAVPAARATNPRSLQEIRAHIASAYDDGAPEIVLILDSLDAYRAHMDTLVEEFDHAFTSIIDQAEPLSRRLDHTKAALTAAEKTLGEVNRLLAESTGNQQRVIDALAKATAAIERHATTLGAAISAARQGGPLAKAAAQLVPILTFIAGAAALYFFLVWMR